MKARFTPLAGAGRRAENTRDVICMETVYEGHDDATGCAFAVVVSRYNEYITQRLLDGTLGVLRDQGAERVDVVWVPGALEIPLAAQRLAGARRPDGTPVYDGVICLGCVIKGETLHFDLVASHAAAGMARVSLDSGVPVVNEVLAVYDPAHATARAGGTLNRGVEAAHAAIRMANLMRALPGGRA